jgi:hypothetical protein
MQDNTVARLQSTDSPLPPLLDVRKCGCKTTEYRSTNSPLPPLLDVRKCTGESLSEDSQNISCVTLKRRGSRVISIYLWSGSYATLR